MDGTRHGSMHETMDGSLDSKTEAKTEVSRKNTTTTTTDGTTEGKKEVTTETTTVVTTVRIIPQTLGNNVIFNHTKQPLGTSVFTWFPKQNLFFVMRFSKTTWCKTLLSFDF